MADPIEVTRDVRVPASAIEARSVRSSGPGGQNVNKVASRIELLVVLAAIEGLDDGARARLDVLTRKKRDADGRLRVTAQESRDRSRNLETAREKVRLLVEAALVVPKARRPTRPGRAARERRLTEKKRDARVKGGRRAPGVDD
jgi:ribosome-associated protein